MPASGRRLEPSKRAAKVGVLVDDPASEGARRRGNKKGSGLVNAELAGNLVAAAIAKAKADYGRPICVAVCDRYGFLTAFVSMDDAPVRSIQLSQGKAYTSARMGVDTDAFLQRLHANNIPASYFCDDKLTGLPGGCVLKGPGGGVIGAVGISGLTPDEDMAIAKALVALASAEGA